MSRKSARIVKREPVPRAMAEINKEYSELIGKSGQVQYQIAVLKNELDYLNDCLLEVNEEAAKRNELDKTSVPAGELIAQAATQGVQ